MMFVCPQGQAFTWAENGVCIPVCTWVGVWTGSKGVWTGCVWTEGDVVDRGVTASVCPRRADTSHRRTDTPRKADPRKADPPPPHQKSHKTLGRQTPQEGRPYPPPQEATPPPPGGQTPSQCTSVHILLE